MAKKEQEQLDQEAEDALDFSGEGVEASRGSYGDDDDEDYDDTDGEEQAEDEDGEEQEDDEEVATEDEEGSIEEDDDEASSSSFTIDGKKYTAEQIASDPKLLSKMATHYNQVGNFQKLAEERSALVKEREEQIQQLEAEKRKIMDEWTRMQMLREQEQYRQQPQEQQAPARPAPDQIRAAMKPLVANLAKEGRLTEDELDEHEGLIAEYLFDSLSTRKLIEDVTSYFAKEINSIRGFIDPAVKSWDEDRARQADASVQSEAAKIEGYEDLADPQIWNELKQYITKKVLNSPKDSEGNPTFNPIFDAETMAEQFDAMQGRIMRTALRKTKKTAEQIKKGQAKKATGSASSGGKAPQKKQRPKGRLTPAEAALDFGDSRYAGG